MTGVDGRAAHQVPKPPRDRSGWRHGWAPPLAVFTSLVLLLANIVYCVSMRIGDSTYRWHCNRSGIELAWNEPCHRSAARASRVYGTPEHEWVLDSPSPRLPQTWLAWALYRVPDPTAVFAQTGFVDSTVPGLMAVYLVEPGAVSGTAAAGLEDALPGKGWAKARIEALEASMAVLKAADEAIQKQVLERLGRFYNEEFAAPADAEEFLARLRTAGGTGR